MPQLKTLQTIPSSPRLVDVVVTNVHMQFEEDYFEAWADIEEHKYSFPMYRSIFPDEFRSEKEVARKGRVRLSIDAVNELGRTMNSRFLVEDSHVEWKT